MTVAVAVALAAIALAYAPVLGDLVRAWTSVPYYSYGALVPAFTAFVLWDGRAQLRASWRARRGPRLSAIALGSLVLGISAFLIGRHVGSLSLSALSLPCVVAGVALTVLGPTGFRAVAFPIAFLAFMAPVPAAVLAALSLPMQYGAAAFTEGGLHVFRIPVVRDGLMLYLNALTVEVTEACNGLRFLLAMAVVGVAVAWASQRTWWGRGAVVVLALVTAVLANMLRVLVTAVLGHAFGLGAATGTIHIVYGKVVYLAMLAPFALGVLWIRRAFPPRTASSPEDPAAPAPAPVYFSR